MGEKLNKALRLAMLVSCGKSSESGRVIADWLHETSRDIGLFDVDRLNLADLELPPTPMYVPPPHVQDVVRRLGARLAEADAFIVVTPEYNHSFPAQLKIIIDWNLTPWQAKPVAFVSYGGRGGGIRAVEQLRQVFAELHAVSIRDSMSFHGPQDPFDDNGQPADAAGARLAAKTMLDRLSWWARALADAREKSPYSA